MGQLVTGQTTVNTTFICTSVQFYFVVTVTMAVADIPDDDLAGLQLKCNQVTDDSLESTRRRITCVRRQKMLELRAWWPLMIKENNWTKWKLVLTASTMIWVWLKKLSSLWTLHLASSRNFGRNLRASKKTKNFGEKLREEAVVALSLQLQLRLVRVLLLPESPMMTVKRKRRQHAANW